MNLSFLCELQAAYKLDGRTVFQGLPISIENRKGSVRKGKCEKGKPHTCWRTKMSAHYGYIKGVPGVDGDALDCFIGPNPNSKTAYVVTTLKAPDFKQPDEHKVMLGWDSAAAAKKALIANYGGDARHFGSLDAIPFDTFKARILRPSFKPHKLTASKLERAMEVERVRADGEPNAYGGGFGHYDATPTFHPPSLKKTKPVPVDDPMEKDDKFLDVTKRKERSTHRFRMEQIKKHTTLGGIPPNTGMQHHTDWGSGSVQVL
jgi:hypothetical protein